MSEEKRLAGRQPGRYVAGIDIALEMVGNEDHDHFRPGRRLGGIHDLETSLRCLLHGRAVGAQADNDLDS